MKRHNILKNPRVRRMLNLVPPINYCNDRNEAAKSDITEVSETGRDIVICEKACRDLNEAAKSDITEVSETGRDVVICEKACRDLNDASCSHHDQYKENIVIVDTLTSVINCKTALETNIAKNYNTRETITRKDYNERDNDDSDFSLESSEYIPSPREITSDTLSATSSVAGDSFFIDTIINKNIGSPSTLPDLCLVLDNIDFVASPSAIYKNLIKKVNNEFPQQHDCISEYDNISIFKIREKQKLPSNLPEISYHDNIFENSDTTLIASSTNNTIKEIDTTLENSEIVNSGKTIGNYSGDSHNRISLVSSNDIVHEDNVQEPVRLFCEESIQIPQSSSPSILNNDNQIEPSILSVKKLSRKRKCDKNEWFDIKNKRLKHSGQDYTGCRSKKRYSAKIIGPVCSCKKKCGDKFTADQRQSLFNNFYKLQSHECQWQYISRRIISNPIKKLTLERKNNRTQTLTYTFPLAEHNITVCKTFFLNTLKISEQLVYTALEKIKKDESMIDNRGKHLNRPHKTNSTTKEIIMKHINLFPVVESHYVRKESSRLYLSENLNISKMYRLYQSWFSNQNYAQEHFASKRQYESIFNTEYNYSFFKPKKDLCSICSQYDQAADTEKVSLEDSYRKHRERKDKVREIKREDKASVDPTRTTVAVFDLEKVLSVPQSEVGIFHYKRKYPIYNFTIFNSLNKSGYCYVWHLSVAKRGSNEIGSCLLQFIQEESQKGIKNISFYSDGCAGQNKNRFIFAMYLYALKTYGLECITHRFFETGHSQSEGDSMHSCIERAMKNKVLYTPDQVYSIIQNAKVKGEKYIVKEMEQNNFFDLKRLIVNKNWLKDTQGKKISWSKVMEIKVSQERPHVLQLKYNFNEEYIDLDTDSDGNKSKRGRRPKNLAPTNLDTDLAHLYRQPLPLPKPLYNDLLGLCANQHIPKHYHAFYNSLVCCGNSEQTQLDDLDELDLDEASEV